MEPGAHVPRPVAPDAHTPAGVELVAVRAHARAAMTTPRQCIKAPPSYTRPKRHHLAALCFRCILQTWSVIPPDDDEQTELLTRLYLESCPVDSVASKISRYEHAYLSLSAFARYLYYEQIIDHLLGICYGDE